MRPALTLLVLLAAAAPARAQSVTLPMGGTEVIGLAEESDGSALIGVHGSKESEGWPCGRLPRTGGFVVRRHAGGRFDRVRPLPGDLMAGPLRLREGRYVALVGRPVRVGPACNPKAVLSLVQLDRQGRILGSRRLNRPVPLRDAELAVSSGAVAAAWIEEPRWFDTRRLKVLVAGRVRTLRAPRTVFDASLTRMPTGRASRTQRALPEFLLAWSDRHRVHIDQFDRRGRFRPRRVAGRTFEMTRVHAGAAQYGRAVVAWTTQDGGEERGRPLTVRTTQRGNWSLPFTPARTLGGGGIADDPAAGSALAVSPARSAVFVWGDVTPAGTPFYASFAAARGNLRAPMQLGDGAREVSAAFSRGYRAYVAASFDGVIRVYHRFEDSFVLDREIRPGGSARLWRQDDGSVLITIARGRAVEVATL